MEKVYKEKELILPALSILESKPDGLTTTELIAALRERLKPEGKDTELLSGRKDDIFSQKVRNLISHKSIIKYVTIKDNTIKINQEGIQFIADSMPDDYSPYLEDNDNFREENYGYNFLENNYEPDNIYFSVYDLKRKYDRTINGIEENGLKLNPNYQRADGIWSTKDKSLFIESIILNIPIPSIYLSEDSKGTLIVIDGQQRLSTLFDFIDDKFKLQGLSILKDLNKLKFSKLTGELSKYKSKIEDRSLHIAKLTYGTDETSIIETFERVNTKGAKLNAQEIRNAIHQGKATELLNYLSDYYSGQNQIIDKKRMKDKYLILRYFAMKNYYISTIKGKKVEYNNISAYLSLIMKSINKFDDKNIETLRNDFISTYNKALEVFGEYAFRIKPDLPINMILFELTLILVSELFDKDANIIKDAYARLISYGGQEEGVETDFEKNIKYHRDSEENVKERLLWVYELVRKCND